MKNLVRKVTLLKTKFYAFVSLFLGSFFYFTNEGKAAIDIQYEEVPLLSRFATYIVNPIIVMFFGLALAYFVFGILRFIVGGENEEVRQKGRDHILWGLVGMGIMFSAWAILKIVTNTFSLNQEPITILREGN